jgi:hypothetical protein
MKAYYLSIKDNDDAGQQVVFANTAKEAKKLVSDDNLVDSLEEYTDLRVNRAPKFDGMENLDDAHLALEQWKWGWIWFDMDYPDPDEATDEEFIKWYESTF